MHNRIINVQQVLSIIRSLIDAKDLILSLNEPTSAKDNQNPTWLAKANLCHFWLSQNPEHKKIIEYYSLHVEDCFRKYPNAKQALHGIHQLLKHFDNNSNAHECIQALASHIRKHPELTMVLRNDFLSKLVIPAKEWLHYYHLPATQKNIEQYQRLKIHPTKPPVTISCTLSGAEQLHRVYQTLSTKRSIEAIPNYATSIVISSFHKQKLKNNTLYLLKDERSAVWELFFINDFGKAISTNIQHLPELAAVLNNIPAHKDPNHLSLAEKNKIMQALQLYPQLPQIKKLTGITLYANQRPLVTYDNSSELGASFDRYADPRDPIHKIKIEELKKNCIDNYRIKCDKKEQRLQSLKIQLPNQKPVSTLTFFDRLAENSRQKDVTILREKNRNTLPVLFKQTVRSVDENDEGFVSPTKRRRLG